MGGKNLFFKLGGVVAWVSILFLIKHNIHRGESYFTYGLSYYEAYMYMS